MVVCCRAVVWLCQREKVHQIYNVVDDNDTTQGYITEIVSDIFNIKHDYWGNKLSNIAKVRWSEETLAYLALLPYHKHTHSRMSPPHTNP